MNRRGFTIGPAPILLVLVLAGLLAWRAWVKLHYAGPGGSMRPGFFTGVVYGSIALGLACVAVAGGVGAFCYLASRRKEHIANLAIAATLLLPISLFGYQGVTFLTSAPGRSGAAGPVTSPQPGTLAQPAAQPDPGADGLATPAGPPPPLQPPLSVTPTPGHADVLKDTRIDREFAAVREEVSESINDMWPKVEVAFADWAKPPRHDMRVLDARKQAAAELKGLAERLGRRLKDLSKEAESRLAGSGIEPATARSESGRFAVEYNALWRASACDTISRAAERIIEESDALQQGFSKWSIDAAGEITSKDFAFKGKATGMRMQAEFSVRDAAELRERLENAR